MRRIERVIREKDAIEKLIKENNVLRLALAVDNTPYLVPLNYGYDGAFYMHCAKEGKKLDMIRKNSYVCFEIDSNHELVRGEKACNFTMKYQSIIGYAHAEILEDESDVEKALDVIMKQFSDQEFEYAKTVLSRVAIIKLTVTEMVGKSN